MSLGFVLYSWPFLRNPRSHGFYRFFAFESLLVLSLLNAGRWFEDPFSHHKLASWLFLSASIIMAAHGFYLIRVIGKARRIAEYTSNLVTVGIYRCIRHPLYGSLLFLGWGVFFKDVSPLSSTLVLMITGLLLVTVKLEEAENVRKFGKSYEEYMKNTKMFVPFLF